MLTTDWPYDAIRMSYVCEAVTKKNNNEYTICKLSSKGNIVFSEEISFL